MNHYFFFFRFI